MAYLTNSDSDLKKMRETIGVERFEDLINNIPEKVRFNGSLNLPKAASEFGISRLMQEYADRNETYTSFLGGGVYNHYVPSIIEALTSRSEFYTSYTPYQAEVSQGNLQAMYEFQSMICALTEMDVTNASMYEAGSALAEAVLLATQHTRKNKVLIADTINCRYYKIVETYATNMDIELVGIPHKNFIIDAAALADQIDDSVAAVVLQHPNYFGFLEDVENIFKTIEDKKALAIQVYDPISLGLLKTPGAFGADIAVAEGQALGNAQNYGGPFLGLFSATVNLIRKMPGRIAGVTKDVDGKKGYVLTLQTREQHIRREKATSNICTNSGLLAIAAAIYLSAMGKHGIRRVAELCLQKAHYLADNLCRLPGVELASAAPFFKEFTLSLPITAESVIKRAMPEKIFAGIDLKQKGYPNHLLIAVTEKTGKDDMDRFSSLMQTIISG